MKEIVRLVYECLWIFASLMVVISNCFILKKAGEKWWFGIIPVACEYKLLKISCKKRWTPVYVITELIAAFIFNVGLVFINNWKLLFQSLVAPLFLYSIIIMGVIYYLFMIAFNVNLSLHFGKSEHFGMAAAILPFIFLPIIAFGKSEYQKDAKKWMFV